MLTAASFGSAEKGLRMLRVCAAVFIGAVTGLVPAALVAGEASIEQVGPRSAAGQCALCDFYQVTPSSLVSAPPVYVKPGPPNTHDIVQLGDNNVAIGMVVGPDNYLGQFQLGSNNVSVVGLIAKQAAVSVVQNGDNLRSNLLVWGNPGAPVTVYQPAGSAPVNAAIFTAADGKQVILPGNATTVIKY